jgi:hypothetical protein
MAGTSALFVMVLCSDSTERIVDGRHDLEVGDA